MTHAPPMPTDSDEPRVGPAAGRRFAIFASILLLAHLLLPWFVDRHGGQTRLLFWWDYLLNWSLPDPVLFQIGWMGVTLGGLAGATVMRSARFRGWSLVVVGTVGLLMIGWVSLVDRTGSGTDFTRGDQVPVFTLMAILLATALNAGQLRLSALLPGVRMHRLIAAAVAALALGMLAALPWMVGLWGDGGLLSSLVPMTVADTGLLLLVLTFLLALLAAGCLLSLPLPLLGGGPAGWLARVARWVMQLGLIGAPLLLAWLSLGDSRTGPWPRPAPLFEARILAVYCVYWFAVATGGEMVLLLHDYGAVDEGEEF